MARNGKNHADDRLASEIASGKSIRDAAEAAGVSERTAHRRVKEKKFAARVKALRGAMVDRAAGRLADSLAEATDVLRALLSSESETVQLRAADLLLSHSVKLAEVSDLEQRLEALERQHANAGSSAVGPRISMNGTGAAS